MSKDLFEFDLHIRMDCTTIENIVNQLNYIIESVNNRNKSNYQCGFIGGGVSDMRLKLLNEDNSVRTQQT